MSGVQISQLPALVAGESGDLLPLVQDYTAPGTGTTYKATAAQLALGTHGVFNVKAYGATGDGVTDDTTAIGDAAAACTAAGGGILWFPSGTYLVSSGTALSSGTIALGAGRSNTTIKAVNGFVSTPGPEYSFFYNENWAALALSDHDIGVQGFTFDYSWNTAGNAFASCKMRYVSRLVIRDNYFYYGGNSIAIRGCDKAWVQFNSAFGFKNCAWDFWEGPLATWVESNYAETDTSNQMMNFNPEVSPVASSPLNVVAKGFTARGNKFKVTGGASVPSQIEPLGNRDNSVRDVVIEGNSFERSYLVMRGYCENFVVSNNVFWNFPVSSTNIIRVYPLNGYTPDSFQIVGNVINEPNTDVSQFGVIWLDATNSLVVGNIITGTYSALPFYQGTAMPVQVGNYFEKFGLTGRIRQGIIVTNPLDGLNEERACFGWENSQGDFLRMYMETDTHEFWVPGAAGAPRQVWSMQTDTNNADWTILIGVSIGNALRLSPDTGLTATGSTQAGALGLTKNFNNVTTVAASTGVRLPAGTTKPITGIRVVVWNNGANNLNVYPPTSAQIDATGLNNPVVLAPGAKGVYVAMGSTLYLTEN